MRIQDELRASELEAGSIFREYGMDTVHKVDEIDWHGDTALITTESGDETTLDRDTVVANMAYAVVDIEGTFTLANGRSVKFSIGEVAGDLGWFQEGAPEEVLGQTVHVIEGLLEKIQEDDLMVVVAS